MKLSFSAEDEAFREELIAFIEANCPAAGYSSGDFIGTEVSDGDGIMVIPDWAREWQAALFDNGWMIPAYGPELGGRNATPTQTLIYLEELASRGIPRSVHFVGYAIAGPSLLEFGNPDQRALAPAAIRGDTVWCAGMSEPGAGSDLANISTRAVDEGDHFKVNGQKVWTSYAMLASKCLCYVRTDPDVPKHRGISALIIDMDTPGIEVRPLRHITGQAEFAEVFFTDVLVPKRNLVGEQGDGWRITMGALAHERGGLWVEGVAGCQRSIDDILTMIKSRGRDQDKVVRRRVAELYSQVRGLRALGYKGFASFAQGTSAPEHSFMKVATSELHQTLIELAMDLQGAGLAVTDRAVAESKGRWQQSFFTGLAATIGGGTSEVQRNVIAQRVLGLPRGR
ncbi:MAG: acyl-CoA dehydrogenase family protein [Deltaproteobacteria bacterium]|nr:acyl-CoA dehydrogenase family protein [Deltaproteobacteria bacterium]